MSLVRISTDGSGIATGGPGGWAAVLRFGDVVKELAGGEREATNNSMELMAAVRALQTLRRPCEVELTTDSEYLKNGAEQWIEKWRRYGWKTIEGADVKNRELWEELAQQIEKHTVTWKHVPGHSGHVDNERCDVLAGVERLKIKDAVDGIDTGAKFSEDRLYRYALWRIWNPGPEQSICNFLMLNPSTADEVVNDPTVERCERRARAWGYGGVLVTNIFAYRATDPEVLKTASDPIGPKNDDMIEAAAKVSDLIVCAWGNHGGLMGRSARVREILSAADIELHCLKMSKTKEPAHPLYLPYKLQPIPMTR